MDTLTACPSKLKYWVVPPLSRELDSNASFGGTRRRRFPSPYLCMSNCSTIGALRRSRNFLVYRSEGFFDSPTSCIECGFRYRTSKFKFMPCIKPKRSRLEPLVALAWALKQQATGNEVNREDNDSANSFLVGTQGEGVSASVRIQNLDGDEASNEIYGEKKGQNRISSEQEQNKVVNTRLLAKCLQSAHTVEDVEEILKDYGEMPPQVYSTVIRGLGKDKRVDSALILLRWLKMKSATDGLDGPNIFIYNSLLGAVKQSGAFAEAEKILSDMAEEGVIPNAVTYNTLMAIYMEQGEHHEALAILEEIQRKGLTPTPASYSQAMLTYRRMEDGDGALRLFIEFRDKYRQGEIGQKDDGEDWENEFEKLENFTIRVCYQVMRGWLVRGGDSINNVLKLLTSMDYAEIPPGRVELERLVWACTSEEHYNVAKELYARIREKHSDISLSVCNHVIWLMGKAKKWWAALEVYEDLLEKGPHPNNLSYELIMSHFNFLLTAARKKGIWRWGVRLLNKMEEKGLKPRSREWNAVLVACSKASETAAAVQIFKRMVEQGEKPTVISYGALLSALEKGKLYDEALQVWNHMLNVGVEPNAYVYTIMASMHAAQGKFKTVDSIIREMSVVGIELTAVTYNAIISGCARNSMSSAAYEWFHRMRVQNITPNEITYEMLIEALAKDGKPRLAYEQYLKAQNDGLKLTFKAYDAVVESCQVNGATVDLSVLGPRPPDKKKKESAQVRRGLTEFYNLADVPKSSPPFDRTEIFYNSEEK